MQFFKTNAEIRVFVITPDQHFDISLFSNPGARVLIHAESRGPICSVVFHLLGTMSGYQDNAMLHGFKAFQILKGLKIKSLVYKFIQLRWTSQIGLFARVWIAMSRNH